MARELSHLGVLAWTRCQLISSLLASSLEAGQCKWNVRQQWHMESPGFKMEWVLSCAAFMHLLTMRAVGLEWKMLTS